MEELEFEVYSTSIIEIEENLQNLYRNIIKDVAEMDQNSINEIFRCVHSIKASAQICGIAQISGISHSLENLLIGLRENEFPYDDNIKSCLLNYNDQIYNALEEIKRFAYYVPNFKDLNKEIEMTFKSAAITHRYATIAKEKDKDKEKFLIIDDDIDFSNYVKKILLREFDLDTMQVTDGLNALNLSNQNKYSLIICDYKLPIINGTEFIHRIRNSENPNKSSSIIFTSAFEPEDLKTKDWENVIFLKKPIEANKLIHYSKFGMKNK